MRGADAVERNPKAWRDLKASLQDRKIPASALQSMDAIVSEWREANARQVEVINRLLAERETLLQRLEVAERALPAVPVAGSTDS
jgi:hypothetical protein